MAIPKEIQSYENLPQKVTQYQPFCLLLLITMSLIYLRKSETQKGLKIVTRPFYTLYMSKMQKSFQKDILLF